MALIAVTGGQAQSPVTAFQIGGPVKRYRVVINGMETTLLLSDADAKAAGLFLPDEPMTAKARKPANKSRAPRVKRDADD